MGREIGLDTGISAGLNLRVLLLEEESGNYCGKTETSHQFARSFLPGFLHFLRETRGEKFVKQRWRERWIPRGGSLVLSRPSRTGNKI